MFTFFVCGECGKEIEKRATEKEGEELDALRIEMEDGSFANQIVLTLCDQCSPSLCASCERHLKASGGIVVYGAEVTIAKVAA